MFKFVSMISLFANINSLNGGNGDIISPPMLGGSHDDNGCLISAGYSWCEDSQNCIRHWETPCHDNYSNCKDCLGRQRSGENIACPVKCNRNIDDINSEVTTLPVPITEYPRAPHTGPMPPMPPIPPTPTPIEYHPVCPEVMCMIYCENGSIQDENGCDTCSCNDPMIVIDHLPGPYILGGIRRKACSELQNAVINKCNSDCHHCDLPDTQTILGHCVSENGVLATDILCNGHQSACPIPYSDCSELVCPKVTEITQCSEGGISGYTTYQLSLLIQSPSIKNIYALYGGESPHLVPMNIPPAYQGQSIFNNNIGGTVPEIIAINSDSAYDSWLTVGLTDGDPQNKLATIGIDFNSWTVDEGIQTTNGAVFVMDPEDVIVTGREYVIAQLTIPTGSTRSVVVNVQGETFINGPDNTNRWLQEQIRFQIEPPEPVNPNIIPPNCVTWFDGCNTCSVNNGVFGMCTRVMCFEMGYSHCEAFDIPRPSDMPSDMNGH
jgi:hypothetical protein